MAVSAISPEINRTAQTLAQPVDRGSGKKAAVKKDEPRQQEAPAPVAVNSEAAANAVRELQPVINGLGLGLEFSTDGETGARIIRVYDLETGEVIRQIPPDEVLDFMRQFRKHAGLTAGLLFSRRL